MSRIKNKLLLLLFFIVCIAFTGNAYSIDKIMLGQVDITPQCYITEECPAGYMCVGGLCVAIPVSCTDDFGCPVGQMCVGGVCTYIVAGCDGYFAVYTD
jgi:hypothetical protein